MYDYKTTQKDVDFEINKLNRDYGFTDKTAVKFCKYRACGGTQIVLKDRRSGAQKTFASFGSASACLNDLYRNQRNKYFKTDVNHFRRSTINRYKKVGK